MQRSQLLTMLSTVQVQSDELAMMDSVAHLGTKNSKLSALSKRPLPADLREAIRNRSDRTMTNGLSGLSGKRKRRRLHRVWYHVLQGTE